MDRSDAEELAARVLVLYTGGTIGMRRRGPGSGYAPAPPGFLWSILSSMVRFHDPELPVGQHNTALVWNQDTQLDERVKLPALISPVSYYGKRIRYSILEYDPLLDSSNMTMSDWSKIASDIERNYKLFDAFVILHGTDTMAYSASALSFMLENLGKSVILTGSQVPISEIRNDGIDNFLGALTIAAHFIIPEVTLFFANRLFRGNRTSKVNASEFNAFDSPNIRPLVQVGITIDVEWDEIMLPKAISKFRVQTNMNPNVATLRLFPGITESTIRAFLSPPVAGVVLETFGAGNAPNNRPELLRALQEASDRGIVIVNCTQCKKGIVNDSYETGMALAQVGVVPGSDMTPECALTKLSYLLGKEGLSLEQVRTGMRTNLRGELTSVKLQFQAIRQPQGLLYSLLALIDREHTSLIESPLSASGGGNSGLNDSAASSKPSTLDNASTSGDNVPSSHNGVQSSPLDTLDTGTTVDALDQQPASPSSRQLEKSILPMLLCHFAKAGDIPTLQLILSQQPEYIINLCDYDGRTPLHIAACYGSRSVVEFLLHHGSQVHVRDAQGKSPLYSALWADHVETAKLLRDAGAHFTEADRVQELIWASVRKGSVSMLQVLLECGADYRSALFPPYSQTILHVIVTEGGGRSMDLLRCILDWDLRQQQLYPSSHAYSEQGKQGYKEMDLKVSIDGDWISSKDDLGRTAVDLCSDRQELASLLTRHQPINTNQENI